jgi:hypothetical protein
VTQPPLFSTHHWLLLYCCNCSPACTTAAPPSSYPGALTPTFTQTKKPHRVSGGNAGVSKHRPIPMPGPQGLDAASGIGLVHLPCGQCFKTSMSMYVKCCMLVWLCTGGKAAGYLGRHVGHISAQTSCWTLFYRVPVVGSVQSDDWVLSHRCHFVIGHCPSRRCLGHGHHATYQIQDRSQRSVRSALTLHSPAC